MNSNHSEESGLGRDILRFADFDTLSEVPFRRLVKVTALTLRAPMALLTMFDEKNQWFRTTYGAPEALLDDGLPFCRTALDLADSDHILIVPNLELDQRFALHPLVNGDPYLRFYAGIPLKTETGQVLGTLCILDTCPRVSFNPDEQQILLNLSSLAIDILQAQVDRRRLAETQRELEEKQHRLNLTLNKSRMAIWTLDIQSGVIHMEADFAALGFPPDFTITQGAELFELVHPEDRAFTRQQIDQAVYQTGHYELQARLLLPTGRVIWISSRGTVEHDSEGRPLRLLVVTFDVTEQREAEAALARSESMLRQIIETTQDAMYLKDKHGKYLVVNHSAANMMRRMPDEVLGGRDVDFIPSDRLARVQNADKKVIETGQILTYEHPSLFSHQKNIFLTTKSPFIQSDEIQGVLGISRDITEQKRLEEALRLTNSDLELKVQERTQALEKLNEQLQHDAFHDALTDLPNRALFMDRLNQAIQRKQNNDNNNYAVLFFDFDRFKLINDSMGHRAGDELLTSIAQRFCSNVASVNTVARLGGDEFVILLEDVHSREEVSQRAQLLQHQLALPFLVAGQEVYITASLGITLCDQQYEQASEALRDADIAMYRAKTDQKGGVIFFEPAMLARRVILMNLHRDLHHAIAHREFRVYYQPILHLASRQIVGVEALVRWLHPEHGLISPAEFIPLAEESGLICDIDLWVLREAGRQLKRWNTGRTRELYLNVNLSARHFDQAGIVQNIWRILVEEDINPQCIRLEITESLLVARGERTLQILRQLRSLGVSLIVDDFGTGYSSLGYLQQFPLDGLKIDRSFVSNAIGQPEVLQTIINLGRSLKMYLVAEGLETEEQVKQLEAMSCELGQGYFFARPMSSEAIDEYLNVE